MGNGKLKGAKTRAEIWRTIFAGSNTVLGLSTLLLLIYVNFLR